MEYSKGVKLSDPKGVKLSVEWKNRFTEALENDLNLPQAVAVVWEMLKSDIDDGSKYELLLEWDKVLGLRLGKIRDDKGNKGWETQASEEVKKLLEKRDSLRKEKKWVEADEVRKEIEDKGWLVEDTPEGPKLVQSPKCKVQS